MGFRDRFPFLAGLLWALAGFALLVATQLLSDTLLGIWITGFSGELMALAIFSVLIAFFLWLTIWPIKRIVVKRRLERLVNSNFGVDTPKYFRFGFVFGFVFIFLLIPHMWMSHKLKPLKLDFDKAAKGEYSVVFTGNYSDGRPVNELDYGGHLDGIVKTRMAVLAKYGFVPLGTGQWWVSDSSGVTKIMAYVWVPLPPTWSRGVAYYIWSIPEKDRQEIEAGLAKLPY